ncbi:peptidoglycan-binding protein [Streptomyces celluloflavus]|uniref:peptidoglycan-binding protein n=1 Tax=Streptomyces celluloflavus TaxID=58344 RepID=UPI0036A34B96
MATPLSATKLLAALRAEGVNLREYTSWRTHNRNHKGAWGPVNGVLIHHTAGSNSLAYCHTGSSALPGPLCHTHLAKTGAATMVSAGRANHAGKAAKNAFNAVVAESGAHPKPSAASGTVDGNARFYGIEIENRGNGKDPYPAAQYDAAVRWAAAICRAHGWSAHSVVGHKETSIEGKIDPSFDMNTFRRDVAARLKNKPGGGKKPAPPAGYEPFPGEAWFKKAPRSAIVTAMGRRLVAEGCSAYKQGPGPQWSNADRESFRKWQRKLGNAPQYCDGWPGPKQWAALKVPKVN